MQTMRSSFEEFRKTIEPDEGIQKIAQAADDPVREHLEGHWSFAERHVTTFLYGSYKCHTAEGDIKDVDLVVVTNLTMKTNPIEVLEELRNSLAELYGEPDLADQRRSIRVDRPLPEIPGCKLTLDVIPAIYQGKPEEPLWVPDREKKQWVLSHPRGHIQYTSELNAQSSQGRMFVPLVKMMKYWWKYQFERWHTGTQAHRRKPKGFWVEVMTGEYTDLSKRSYPELVVSLLENAFGELKTFRTDGKIPELKDPGLKRQNPGLKHPTIKTSMTGEEFRFFLGTMEKSLKWAKEALRADNERRASECWQEVFGPSFPLTEETSKSISLLSAPVKPSGLGFPNRPVMPQRPEGFA
jgi:Second Messenger Oligonucleotide or Dinucleotide Synthetase domain